MCMFMGTLLSVNSSSVSASDGTNPVITKTHGTKTHIFLKGFSSSKSWLRQICSIMLTNQSNVFVLQPHACGLTSNS